MTRRVRMLRFGFTRQLLLTAFAFLTICASAGAAGRFVNRVLKDSQGEHKYAVYLPDGYSAQQKWPVVLFLHGAGERGTDGVAPTKVGLGGVLRQSKKPFPFVVVFPQCEDVKSRYLTGWRADTADAKRALKILNDVEQNYSIDGKRRILSGWSMGGYGAWSIAAATPEHWAGVVPVAGGGEPKAAARLKSVPIWAFHGETDRAVRPEVSKTMVDAVRKAGGRAKLTVVKNAGHDVWKTVYQNDALIAWMRDPSSDPAAPDLLVRPGRRPIQDPDESAPFVPAVEIPRAGFVRLGNDALNAMSYSIPSMVPRNLLTGSINDIMDSTTASGRTFSVQFAGITYHGNVERATIRAIGNNRLRFQLGLRNVQLSINRTYVTGRSRSAVAGPISIIIGHRSAVWLSVDVAPYVQNRKLKLRLVGRYFSIPDNNWYVTAPAGVSTRGLGMTREKVSNGLVDGLYGSKGRIESEVRAIVPNMVKELEKKLVLTDASKYVKSFWPLPVYRPRIRVWPDAISTDKNGVTISLGVTAAAIDPRKAPRVPRRVAPAGPGPERIPKSKSLQVGLAPAAMKPLMQLLVDADVARIHVLDIPEKKFAALADPKVLAEAIPDLKQFGEDVEVWSELVMTESLTVEAVKHNSAKESGSAGGDAAASKQPLLFRVPEMVISLAVKPKSGSSKWTPYAEFRFEMSQQAGISVQRPSFTSRVVRLDWIGDPQIKVKGRFAPEYRPQNEKIDEERIRRLFADGWKAWTASGPAARVEAGDLEFGNSALRLADVGYSAPFISVELKNPGLKITNSTDKPLVYQAKGPRSGWSSALTLKPNASHVYDIPYEMVFRSTTGGQTLLYTLPPGSHSEFRPPKQGGAPRLFKAAGNAGKKQKPRKPLKKQKQAETAAR